MADYQITCVNKEYEHSHILSVGLSGSRLTYTVAQVYSMMDMGTSFHTGSSTGGNYATVAKYGCDQCGKGTLRSHADGKWNNNLDNLPSCP